MTQPRTLFLDPEALVPAAWRPPGSPELPPVFNPGLLADGNGWILACRVVTGDGARRIAFCRLGPDFTPLPGTAFPFSDHVRFTERIEDKVARTWFADPRLYRLGLRTFVYWNSGWHEPRNYQFLQEFDPATLRPLGEAREITLAGERRKLEKNWTFFSTELGLFSVYSITPHRVLRIASLPEGDLRGETEAEMPWDLDAYPTCHGGLRGGSPPVWLGDEYWSIAHSVHDAPDGYRYAAAAYAFSARPPFHPTRAPIAWLPLPVQPRTRPRLNPAVGEVAYPCGAAAVPGGLVVSYGVNDEGAAIAVLPAATLAACTRQLGN